MLGTTVRDPRPRGRHLLAALSCLLLAPGLAAQQQPQFNTFYMCNGQRIVVASCVDKSDKPYNDCIVQFPDRQRRAGGIPASTFVLHSVLVGKVLPACQILGKVPGGSLTASAPGIPVFPGAVNDGGGRPTSSGQGIARSIAVMIGTVVGTGLRYTVILAVIAYIGWRLYNKFYYSRYLVVRRSNKEAIELFGTGDRATRERAILDAFDNPGYTLTLKAQNRHPQVMMWFVIRCPVGTLKRFDLESMRFAYVAYNRGLLDEEKFYTYRITAIYSRGQNEAAEFGYLGPFGFWKARKKQGEIQRVRNAIDGFAGPNSTNNLHQTTIAAIQVLSEKHPQDEFYQDMKMRFFEGARWLGVGDIKNSAFKPVEPPTQFGQLFGILAGSSTPLIYQGDGSILTIAPPGAGKTTCNVVPSLLRWPGAAVVLDVKGEIYDLTSRQRSKYGPVFRFSPLDPEHSHCYNPLSVVRRESLYVWEDASNAAAMMLVPGSGGDKNKFFEDRAREILTAIIADLAFWNKPEDRPIARISSILNRNGWDEFLDRLRKNPEVPAMRDLGVGLPREHPETLAQFLSFALSSMSAWKGERISRITRRSDWHPNVLRTGHPTIYICVNQQDIETYASLLRVFVAQHIQVLMAGKVPAQGADPIYFCIDEFPALGGMKPIEDALSQGRGYGLRLWLFAQHLSQIEKRYTDANVIVGNCAVRTFMKPAHDTAELIAEMIGKEGVGRGADGQSAVSAQELTSNTFENLQIVLGTGSKPAKCVKLPYHQVDVFKNAIGSLDDVAAPPLPASALGAPSRA